MKTSNVVHRETESNEGTGEECHGQVYQMQPTDPEFDSKEMASGCKQIVSHLL